MQGRQHNHIGHACENNVVPSHGPLIYRRGAKGLRETRATLCLPTVDPCQLAGLRAVTIHVAPLIITERSPGQPAKAARTATEARSRMPSG